MNVLLEYASTRVPSFLRRHGRETCYVLADENLLTGRYGGFTEWLTSDVIISGNLNLNGDFSDVQILLRRK